MDDLNAYKAWSSLSPAKLEALVFRILRREGFFNLSWLEKAGPEGGRSIVCQRTKLLEPRLSTHKCTVRCRRFTGDVDRHAIADELATARKYDFDSFVLATNAVVPEAIHDWAENAAKEAGVGFAVWGRHDLETLLDKYQDLRFQFLGIPLSADYFLHQLVDAGTRKVVKYFSLTDEAKAILEEACAMAMEDEEPMTLAHVFLVMMKDDAEGACPIIHGLGGDLAIARENLISIIMEQPDTISYEYGLMVSDSVRNAVATAIELAELFARQEVSEQLLLLAMASIRESYSIEATLSNVNVSLEDFTAALLSRHFNDNEALAYERFVELELEDADEDDPRGQHAFDTMQIKKGGVLRQLSESPARKGPEEED